MTALDDSTLAVLRAVARRALLLTGDLGAAQSVVAGVLRRFERPAGVGDSTLNRAIVQESRAVTPGTGVGVLPAEAPPEARQLFEALRGLTPQQREAWTLTHVEPLGDVEAARAMDCSRTALRDVHLAGADAVLRPLLGPAPDPAAAALRDALARVDVGPMIAAAAADIRRVVVRRRVVRAAALLLFIACCATMWWVMLDLHKANQREIAQRKLRQAVEQKYSNPMTPDEQSSDELPTAPPGAGSPR